MGQQHGLCQTGHAGYHPFVHGRDSIAGCGRLSLDLDESQRACPGDILFLIAGAAWGATTVYIKKYLALRAEPLQVLFFQLLFSAPFLFGLSLIFEDLVVTGFSPLTAFSMFYQCIIVAFLSYLAWFILVSRYPVSLLHAFSFFTPVFGVIISGVLILGEAVSPNLIVALIMVSAGMVLVNYRP